MTKTSRSRKLTLINGMHELRKANKGLRNSASKIRKYKSKVEELEDENFQLRLALSWLNGLEIMPYGGWRPDVKYWIDRIENKYKSHK